MPLDLGRLPLPMLRSASALRLFLNVYPPYLGAGIRVDYIASDWRELRASMQLRWYNRNAVGTHFGGSLYSMVDPHLMLLLMRVLGDEYLIWDQTATIRFCKPGRGRMHATFRLSQETIDTIREETTSLAPYRPEFDIDVIVEDRTVIAKVHKVLYVRKKR